MSKQQIIHLNGASSSGKSTLARTLQKALSSPYLHLGLDKIIDMMPEKYNNWEGGPASLGFSWKQGQDEEGHFIQELQMGPYAHAISKAYREIVHTLLKLGHCLIIDDVTFGQPEFARWKKLLRNYKVLYVGIHAPLEILEKREQTRQGRIAGSARAQHKKVHKGITYDLELETDKTTVEENVAKILATLETTLSNKRVP